MAAEDVATSVAEAALSAPVNGTVENTFYIDEIVGRVLQHDKDRRQVVADPEARYFGIKLSDQSLVPGPNPRLGSTKFAGGSPMSRRRRSDRFRA
jgi:hypothetical protein